MILLWLGTDMRGNESHFAKTELKFSQIKTWKDIKKKSALISENQIEQETNLLLLHLSCNKSQRPN